VQVAASPAVKAPAADTAADQSANAQGTAKPRLRWVVRKGDSVYKACFETYGSCYDTTLRAVLADNPQFGSGAVIHEGDILTMPGSIGPLRAKPH
jgi:hypothetical protein